MAGESAFTPDRSRSGSCPEGKRGIAKKNDAQKEERKLVARQFVDQGYPVGKVLMAAGVSSSSFYYQSRSGKPGRKCSHYTQTIDGSIDSNAHVVEQIEALLVQEFVDYGYLKVTHWLRNEKHYVINKKKTYRLMKEHKLLNNKRLYPKADRLWVRELVPNPEQIFEHLEVDIKYIYVHGQRRNALQMSVIDVLSRWVMDYTIAWTMNKNHVVDLFDRIFYSYSTPDRVYIRNDNGSQFVAGLVRDYFEKLDGVNQEFTRPATPEQNAHIEAFHSIMDKHICQDYYLENLEHLKQLMDRFIRFYNEERIHSGVGFTSPLKYIKTISPGFNGGRAQPGSVTNPSMQPTEGLALMRGGIVNDLF
jgi:transposase InsO family protein